MGRKYPLGQNELTIGRDPSNAVAIPDVSVSRFHAKVFLHGLQPVIADLGSTHGTWVNRQRISVPTPISTNDQINIGLTDFVLEGTIATAPPAAASPQWPFVAQGQKAHLEVFPDRVRIVRQAGYSNLVLHGIRGDKEIFIRALTGLQYKPVTTFTVGYLQFTFGGSGEAKKGILEAMQDENTISFLRDQEPAFVHAKSLIDRLISESHNPAVSAPVSVADELTKLADLHRQGVLTADEFQRAKARLGI